jgi:hypothetical protein
MAIDYEAVFGVEEYDPCAALSTLRPAYMRMLAGEGEQEIRFRERNVRFQQGDLTAFGNLITRLEGECAAKRGRTPQRRAITAAPYRL